MKKIVRAVGTFVNNLRRYSAPSVALYDAVRAPLGIRHQFNVGQVARARSRRHRRRREDGAEDSEGLGMTLADLLGELERDPGEPGRVSLVSGR
jgi:hypothetical protein